MRYHYMLAPKQFRQDFRPFNVYFSLLLFCNSIIYNLMIS